MFSASNSSPDEDRRTFLQHRVSQFGLRGGIGFFAFLSYRAIVVVAEGRAGALLKPDMAYHTLAGACLWAVWLLCRWGKHSTLYVRWVESLGLLAAVGAVVAMGLAIPLAAHPQTIVARACTFGFAMRAIYVPSSARRTLTLTLGAGVPILAGTYVHFLQIDLPRWASVMPELSSMTAREVASMVTLTTGVWWLLAVMLCTTASQVIFGLRREAREAKKLGQYTLIRRLGEGGMGEVYLARHAMLRRPTAVKLLHPSRAGEHNLARFEREVQLTSELTHPNTVTIFDYGRTQDGIFYYAMELLDGATVEQVVAADGEQPAARVIHILEQVADALSEAHAIGLIHRDIKPANIILCERGGRPDVAKVLDFGLVKDLNAEQDFGLTSPDVVTGTPLYLAPEVIKSPRTVGAASDIYALGAVGYYLLTGSHVFGGATMMEVCGHHLHTTPEAPSARLGRPVSEPLARLLLACLAKDPKQRPASAAELRRSLLDCNRGEESGAWNDNAARAWWQRHGSSFVQPADAASPAAGQTLLAVARQS